METILILLVIVTLLAALLLQPRYAWDRDSGNPGHSADQDSGLIYYPKCNQPSDAILGKLKELFPSKPDCKVLGCWLDTERKGDNNHYILDVLVKESDTQQECMVEVMITSVPTPHGCQYSASFLG